MYYVYIMSSRRNGALHMGWSIYYEQSEDVRGAIEREKRLKAWKRRWKLRLIEEMNPDWNDLYDQLAK